MNAYETLKRLEAYHQGRPIARGEKLHLPVAEGRELLLMAFVRMGGESAPWGIAFKKGGTTSKLRCLSVPEPRNRDQVAQMVADFGPVLLEHLLHPKYAKTTAHSPDEAISLRQIWVPNASHLEMLHMLAYAYIRTQFGEQARWELLNAIGRACGWLFRESQRPGQISVIDAAAALRESFSFPADDLRQQHTGYLLAWLETRGRRESRQKAAAAAEQLSVATTLDPTYERKTLESFVERYNEARRDGNSRSQKQAADAIDRELEAELRRRIDLVERSIRVLLDDPRPCSLGIHLLDKARREEHWYQYLRIEHRIDDDSDGPAFVPSPETDRNPAAAAARYQVQQASADLQFHALLADDSEMQAEAIAEGNAIRGTITQVWDEGEGRASQPIWVVEDDLDLPLRIRVGSRVCVGGLTNRWGVVRSVTSRVPAGRRVEIEIRGLKTRPRGPDAASVRVAADPANEGTRVILLPTPVDSISRTKSYRTWSKDGPGSWLTHHTRTRPSLPDEVNEELVK